MRVMTPQHVCVATFQYTHVFIGERKLLVKYSETDIYWLLFTLETHFLSSTYTTIHLIVLFPGWTNCGAMDTLFSVHRKWRVTWLVAVVALVTSVLAGKMARLILHPLSSGAKGMPYWTVVMPLVSCCKIYIDVYLMSKRSYSELFPCVCYHRVFKSAPLTSIFFVRSRANDAWNTRARNRALTGPNKNLQSILAACLYLVKKYNRVDQRVDRSVLVRECEYWSEISPACEGWRTLWWRHGIGTLCALLALCEGNPPVNGGFPSQRPVMQTLDFFFGNSINKLLDKRSLANDLTHLGRDKMGDILQTTFSKQSPWMKISEFQSYNFNEVFWH